MSVAPAATKARSERGKALDGRVAIVTGGSVGIGAAIVRLFADEGARVVFCARSEQPGKDLERELKAEGYDVAFFARDIALEDEARALVKETADRFGGLDILVNNAAISRTALVEKTSLADWQLVLNTNLTSMFLMSREAIPYLRRSRHPSIINLGSTYAFVGAVESGVYALTKAGSVSFTKTLALELAPDGIRVNALCPGATVTQLYHQYIASHATHEDREKAKTDLLGKHPLGRLGTPEEMAQAALFLASEQSSFVTGHSLLVDGGFTV
jgi:NAD(P)-dependent dehydrogenase (short-subunit alcohol dehydrogenase family)